MSSLVDSIHKGAVKANMKMMLMQDENMSLGRIVQLAVAHHKALEPTAYEDSKDKLDHELTKSFISSMTGERFSTTPAYAVSDGRSTVTQVLNNKKGSVGNVPAPIAPRYAGSGDGRPVKVDKRGPKPGGLPKTFWELAEEDPQAFWHKYQGYCFRCGKDGHTVWRCTVPKEKGLTKYNPFKSNRTSPGDFRN